jgi:hypothetical protein
VYLNILRQWRRAWYGLPWPSPYLDSAKKTILSTVATLFTTVDALFFIVAALFFTVATLFAMPAHGVRPPPLSCAYYSTFFYLVHCACI